MPGRSTTVRQRRLALELRQLRVAAGLTMEQVAVALPCSIAKISRIETAQIGVSPRDVGDLLKLYGVDGEQRDALLLLAQEARQKGWWHQAYRDLPVVAYVALEWEAAFLYEYKMEVIPGLFQTREYATAIIQAIRIDLTAREIARRVELRMARQSLLTKESAPNLWVVIDEAVLRRQVGGREVMRRQLERLCEVAALPNVTLQVLPFAIGGHAGVDGGFTIVGSSEQAHPDVVHVENLTSDLYLEDSDAVRQYTLAFDHLRATALPPSDSAQFLAKSAKSYGSSDTSRTGRG